MPSNHSKSSDYESLKPAGKKGGADSEQDKTLKPSNKSIEKDAENLTNPRNKNKEHLPKPDLNEEKETLPDDFSLMAEKTDFHEPEESFNPAEELSFSELKKHQKEEKKAQKDFELLNNEFWLARNGHTLTYIGLYLFSILVLFRPYELVSSLRLSFGNRILFRRDHACCLSSDAAFDRR